MPLYRELHIEQIVQNRLSRATGLVISQVVMLDSDITSQADILIGFIFSELMRDRSLSNSLMYLIGHALCILLVFTRPQSSSILVNGSVSMHH